MIQKIFATLFLFGVSLITIAQVNFTANDEVRPFTGPFGYGTNLGYYEGWTDEELVNIAAGNPSLGVSGLGVNSIRPWLPEWFLDQWGYDIRRTTFQHYENLDVKNNAAFIGYPAEWSREDLEHCDGIRMIFQILHSAFHQFSDSNYFGCVGISCLVKILPKGII